jgi:hypothetical protein
VRAPDSTTTALSHDIIVESLVFRWYQDFFEASTSKPRQLTRLVDASVLCRIWSWPPVTALAYLPYATQSFCSLHSFLRLMTYGLTSDLSLEDIAKGLASGKDARLTSRRVLAGELAS